MHLKRNDQLFHFRTLTSYYKFPYSTKSQATPHNWGSTNQVSTDSGNISEFLWVQICFLFLTNYRFYNHQKWKNNRDSRSYKTFDVLFNIVVLYIHMLFDKLWINRYNDHSSWWCQNSRKIISLIILVHSPITLWKEGITEKTS